MEIIGKKIDPKTVTIHHIKNDKSKQNDTNGKIFKLDRINPIPEDKNINWNLRTVPIEKTLIPPINHHKWAVQNYRQQYITFNRQKKDVIEAAELDNSNNSLFNYQYNDFCTNSLRETKLIRKKKPEVPTNYELSKNKFITLKKTTSEPKKSERYNKENHLYPDSNSYRANRNKLPSTKKSKEFADKTISVMDTMKNIGSLGELQSERSPPNCIGKIPYSDVELESVSNTSKILYTKINKISQRDNLVVNPEKKVRKNGIKVYLHMCRGEATLFNHFFENGIFKRVRKPQDSFYCHFSLDREQNFEYGDFTLINRVPGVNELCNKNFTFKIQNNIRKLHEEKFSFYPQTFILPEEYDEFKEYHRNNPKEVLIAKLGAGCHGVGCKILRKPKELPDIGKDKSERIVQSYIDNPHLLNGKKNDLRIYCTIVSYNPLVAFINKEGLARFCTENYKSPSNMKEKINEYEHLSNYTQNKNNPNYVQADNYKEINTGTKRSFISYFKEIESIGQDQTKMWNEIKKVCAGCLKAMKPYILYACKKEWRVEKGKCFHILGIDILFDSELNAHLLEINSNPSLNIDLNQEDVAQKKAKPFFKTEKERLSEFEVSQIDLYVKKKVLGDAVRQLKNNKMSDIRSAEFQKYRSYEKVFDETIEEQEYGDVDEMDKILDMFMALNGIKFTPSLSMSKFSKCVKWFDGIGEKKIQLIDGDMAFKNAERIYSCLDYEGFTFAQYELIIKAYSLEKSSDALTYLDEQYDKFNSQK